MSVVFPLVYGSIVFCICFEFVVCSVHLNKKLWTPPTDTYGVPDLRNAETVLMSTGTLKNQQNVAKC